MGQPRRPDSARAKRDADSIRRMLDAGSLRVVREPLDAGRIIHGRQKWPLPEIGTRSGKLTVTGYVLGPQGGVQSLIVQCSCGRPEYPVDRTNFKVFRSTRCSDCGKRAASRKRYWVYAEAMSSDEHRTRLLNRLAAAITRCHSPTSRSFVHYGRRGISVFKEWRDNRAAFLSYVQALPGWNDPSLEMDRIDTNGNYEPGNIRFATRSVNIRNKRKIADLEARIRELEACIRFGKRGAET